jgi:adenylate cyclase class 2
MEPMYEVELKARADHDRVRTRLSECGGQLLGAVRQEDTYYDAPDRDFAETDEALRVRVESPHSTSESTDSTPGDGDAETVFLTYKGPLVDADSKTREEHEMAVGDADTIRGILSGLGYEPAATVTKERERYELDGCTVTLDHVAEVGAFVEVELETEAADTQETDAAIDAARERAIDILDRLGLDADDQIRTSYLGLVLAAREGSTGTDSTTDE